MADTQDDAASAWGSQGARIRWGNQKVVRAAGVVIDRADELPPAVRSAVHEATGERDGDER